MENQPIKPSQDEKDIDLGVLFVVFTRIAHKILSGFRKLLSLMLSVFIWILLFIRRKIVFLLIGIALGLLPGLFSYWFKGTKYSSSMTVRVKSLSRTAKAQLTTPGWFQATAASVTRTGVSTAQAGASAVTSMRSYRTPAPSSRARHCVASGPAAGGSRAAQAESSSMTPSVGTRRAPSNMGAKQHKRRRHTSEPLHCLPASFGRLRVRKIENGIRSVPQIKTSS